MEFHLHVHTGGLTEPRPGPQVVGAPGGLLLALLQAAGPLITTLLQQLLERLVPPASVG